MEKIISFRLRPHTEKREVISSGGLLLYSSKRRGTLTGELEEITKGTILKRKLGKVPSQRAWRNAAGNKDFTTYTRAKNQVFEYQHAFWRTIITPIDSGS